MNSRERVSAAMDHREPDRVPVMCQLALGHYFLHCKAKPSDIWFDPDTFAAALVELQRRYGFDGILVNIPGRPPDWRSQIKSCRKVGDREYLYWKSGLETVVPPDDNPQTSRAGWDTTWPCRLPNHRFRDRQPSRLYRPGTCGTPGTCRNCGALSRMRICPIRPPIQNGSPARWKRCNSWPRMSRCMWRCSRLLRT